MGTLQVVAAYRWEGPPQILQKYLSTKGVLNVSSTLCPEIFRFHIRKLTWVQKMQIKRTPHWSSRTDYMNRPYMNALLRVYSWCRSRLPGILRSQELLSGVSFCHFRACKSPSFGLSFRFLFKQSTCWPYRSKLTRDRL